MRRIFITGDMHQSTLPIFGIAEHNEITETDILIIAGDAGYVWNDDYPYRINTLEKIYPGTIAFIDGNHENHVLLNGMEEIEWHGGKAHQVGERVFHLMRGEVYEIYGNKFFTFGGARSSDKDRRVLGESWWIEEEPTLEELEYGRKNFMENLNEIDYVITHDTPIEARASIERARKKPLEDDYLLPGALEEWYQAIKDKPRFKKWYFGHMHVDQIINDKLRGLHNDILFLGEEEKVRWA